MKSRPSDTLSQYSYESSQSGDSKDVYVTASDIKRRLTESLQRPTGKGKFKVSHCVIIGTMFPGLFTLSTLST